MKRKLWGLKTLGLALFIGVIGVVGVFGASEARADTPPAGDYIDGTLNVAPYFYSIYAGLTGGSALSASATSINQGYRYGDWRIWEHKMKLVDASGKVYKVDESGNAYNLKPSVYTLTIYAGRYPDYPNQTISETVTFKTSLTVAKKDYKNKFTDLGKVTKERKSSIRWMYQYGITTGVDGKNVYNPSGVVNRGAMAQFLHKLSASVKTSKTEVNPTDISNLTQPGRQADIKWLASEGITVLDNGKFNPQNPVNRGAMAEFMYKTAGSPAYTPSKADLAKVKDIKKVKNNPARQKAIAWLAKNNITVLDKNGNFNPQNNVNRGSMAQFMQKLYKNVMIKPNKTQSKATLIVPNNCKNNQCTLLNKTYPVGTDTLKPEGKEPVLLLGLDGVQRSKVSSLVFDNHKPTTCKSPYSGSPIDVGASKKKQVMACVSADKTKVLIGEDAGVRVNANSQYLFYNLQQAPTLTGFADKTRNWDKALNLTGVFQDYGKNSTKGTISIPEFPSLLGAPEESGGGIRDSTNWWYYPERMRIPEHNFSHMFDGFGQNAKNATSITLPEFPRFFSVSGTKVQVINFGTVATDTSYMFANFAKGATRVTKVTIPEFPITNDASNSFAYRTATMSHMFDGFGEGATSATEISPINIPASWTESGSANLSYMFANFAKDATSVKNVTLPEFKTKSSWGTSNMSHMFENFGKGATSATSVTLPKVYEVGTSDASYMFAGFGEGATNATRISVESVPTGASPYMFANFAYNATNATQIAIPVMRFSVKGVASAESMFSGFAGGTAKMTNDIVWSDPSLQSGGVFTAPAENMSNIFTNVNWNNRKLLLGYHSANPPKTSGVVALHDWLKVNVFGNSDNNLGYTVTTTY
ncbi:MAG: S-layer homology domain-containing protein [Bifidobacteriaceae bacterium]|jgi:hypothetical protein|nr:S-layer homology domain-containing protein [Bifidobacteriaceae bacterium]